MVFTNIEARLHFFFFDDDPMETVMREQTVNKGGTAICRPFIEFYSIEGFFFGKNNKTRQVVFSYKMPPKKRQNHRKYVFVNGFVMVMHKKCRKGKVFYDSI
jgi:hypothetical protein